MAGTVTSLRFQKRTADRVNVYLDGEFACALPAVEAAKLHLGQFLSDDDLGRLRALDTLQKTYERAVRFLSYRPRSQAEVERNLAGAGVDPEVARAVVERLTREGYLNDQEFARFWIENREQFKPRGERALRQELRQKGVDDETSAAAISNVDPATSAYKAAQPRALRLAALARSDKRAFREKLGSFLMRRGFQYDVVREVVAQLQRELAADEGSTTADESE
jgi:regulatory protein